MDVKISYLAKVSKMHTNSKEAKKLQAGFIQTIKTIKLLEKLNTDNIDPNFQVTGLKNIFRSDKINSKNQLTQKQALSNAKQTHNGYFLVPAILHEA